MNKHRSDSERVARHAFTFLDDYLHVVNTVLWLTGGVVRDNETGQLLYAEHAFRCGEGLITTSVHH